MKRMTKMARSARGVNEVCCTHFLGEECQKYSGNCSAGCLWNDVAWAQLYNYEETGLSPTEVRLMYDYYKLLRDSVPTGINLARVRELCLADLEGWVTISPSIKRSAL